MRQLITFYHPCRSHIFDFQNGAIILSRILHQGTIRKTPAIANGSSHERGFANPPDPFSVRHHPRKCPLVKVPQIAQKNRERSFSAVSALGVRYHR